MTTQSRKEEEEEDGGGGWWVEEVGGEEEEEEGQSTHLMGVYQIIHDPPGDTTKVHWGNDWPIDNTSYRWPT
jgi:hypothetical protein